MARLISILLVLITLQAQAFRLEPMVVDFTPTGETATKIFRVENEGKEKIAVKIQAFTRVIDENGKETTEPTSDFKIYPEQMSLEASDSRAIRVVYVGKKTIEGELSYRIVATQLPVDFKSEVKKSGIKFLFQFVASVYVTSEKYYPKIVVESANRVDKEHVVLSLINKGQKHTLLKSVNIELLDTNGKPLKLGSDIIKNWENENILSGGRRVYKLKTNLNFDLIKNPPKISIKDEI